MSSKVELNKNGRPVNWHGQCWTYYKRMMEFVFADKDVLEYATGKETLASSADDAAKKKFADAQMKVKHLIMASLSMELGQQVMTKTNGAAMWKYLEDTYEGKTNSATRTNQEIILFNRLQAAKCKPNWDVQQHVNNMFLLKAQLAALNADMRDPIFTNLLVRSLPSNPRFDRLRGMVEMGASEVDTPEKLRDQIIRLDSYNRCDREIGVTNAANASPQPLSQGQKPKTTQQQARQVPQGQGGNATTKAVNPERSATFATKKTDKQQGNCFGCHKPGHLEKDCPKKATTSSQKQAIYTSRVRVGEGQEEQSGEDNQAWAPDNVKEDTAGEETSSRRGEPHGEDLSVRTGDGNVGAVEEWCFDNAANVHIVSDRRYFTEYTPFGKDAEKVRGFKKQFAAAPAGHGTVELVVERNGKKMTMNLLDAYHVPNCRNLLSHSQAEDQGYAVEFHGRSGQTKFELWREDELVMEVGRDQHGMYTFDAVNDFVLAKKPKSQPKNRPVKKSNPAKTPSANISAADGAADLQTWHERLGHLCPRFLKTMVDNGLVKGMMLRQRVHVDCEDCQLGKERKPPAKKNIDREISRKNEVIFADLLFPEQDEPVLVIVDGYTRFTTVYPLKTKNAPEVNAEMIRYIEWADRQHPTCKVKKVITDGGGEFENDEMKLWYQSKGIEFLPNPPRSSHLNPCERAHQTLVHMMKTMLIAAGFPPSLKMHALKMAAYVRNRCYHETIKDTPFRMMFGKKPDMHRIKKFGSIAYAHKPTGPSRRKMDENCRIGFLAGYREGQAEFDVYFPPERVVQRVEHAHINEGIVFKDRYPEGYTPAAAEWIHSLGDEDLEPTDESDFDESDGEEQNSVEETMEDPDEMSDVVMDDEPDTEGWNTTSEYPTFLRKSVQAAAEPKKGQRLGEDEDLEKKAPPDPALLAEVELGQDEVASEEEHEAELPSEAEPEKEPTPSTEQESTESTLDETTSDDSEPSPDPWQWNVQNVSGAYMYLPLQDEETDGRNETREQDEDQRPEDPDPPNDEHSIVAVEAENGMDVCMVPEVLTGQPRTPLEAELDDVREAKRQRMLEGQPTRMTLRSEDERRRPKHLDDYQIFASYCQQDHAEAENGEHQERCWHSKEVTTPRNFREAMKSPQKEEWLKAMQLEVDAMFSKGVFVMINEDEMPNRTNLLSTMWRYQPKTDTDGYVTRWRARLVGRGDSQEFGVDYVLSFSPVARMVTFRVVVAVVAKLGLTLYQGDINTAYLNALLKIKQFVRGIPGFPWPKVKVYRVDHALYGLHQSGAEWYKEVDKFLISQGYDNTETEPCLYVRYKDGVLALIPLYVDDVVLATNSEDYKTKLFLEFDKKYGFKDGGLANKFLGVQIEQSESGILIHQDQYCKEVLDRFGYGEAHGSASPMETNVKFKPNEESEKNEDISFDYRAAIGSLMYLTTSTRPDIAFPVGYLSRFVSNPSKKHGGAVKRILRYLAATSRQGIKYSNDKDVTDQILVSGHSDADWGNDPETRKSVTGFVMTIAGGAVAWAARRQTIVAQSTAEAEYVAACEAAMEGRGIVNMLNEALVVIQKKSKLTLGVDNTAAIAIAKAPTYNSRTRHIVLRWHYVRDQVKRDLLEIHKVLGTENSADMFTKALPKNSLVKYCQMIGMAKPPSSS